MIHAEVEGVKAALTALRKREGRWGPLGSKVRVGYAAPYAIYVHENLQAHHPVGQAKFLEQPTRTLKAELAAVVRRAMIQGRKEAKALLIAGEKLKEASQALCPVDTGALRASAFVKLE